LEPILLDRIPLQLDQDALVKSLRIKPGSPYLQEFQHLFEAALAIGRPRVYYRMAYVEAKGETDVFVDGVRFSSRILRMNLEAVNHVFAYVATCGQELEAWASGIDNLLTRFWADAISEAALRVAREALSADLAQRYQPGHLSSMNPGSLKDWPITEQVPLFGLLGDVRGAIGVYLTESLLMLPRKSVSGIHFPTESNFASCQLCPREACPGRRADYDPALVAHYQPPPVSSPLSG
jgi:Vitamin B12 dependent methionine synthase, activation domain